jgi:hypothetical protein
MAEILTLCSPHKLLKNLVAHSPNALNTAIFDQNKKKVEILSLYPGYDGMVKKTISRYCLFKLARLFFP